MRKRKEKNIETCFYCGILVTKKKENDHFPIPKRNGGTNTVPSCLSCHDMKDRYGLYDWPIEWFEVIVSDFPKMSRETRLFLVKAISIVSDARTLIKSEYLKQRRFKKRRTKPIQQSVDQS